MANADVLTDSELIDALTKSELVARFDNIELNKVSMIREL